MVRSVGHPSCLKRGEATLVLDLPGAAQGGAGGEGARPWHGSCRAQYVSGGDRAPTLALMRLQERPGPPGPYATPDEIPPPVPDPLTGGTRYADVEYARVMG